MKEAAILTFHRASNYGAFLQAFALQEYLNSMGINAYILDYRCSAIEDYYNLYLWLRKNISIKAMAKFVLDYYSVHKTNLTFKKARERLYKIKDRNVTREDLLTKDYDYDVFIVGSDQVWNRDHIHEDDTFFLDFADESVKKYSYAASMGKEELSQEEYEALLLRISRFDGISLREPYLVPRIKESLLNTTIECSVDPVFLLERNKWHVFSKFINREKYVLFFQIGQSNQISGAYRYAKDLSKQNNLELVYLSNYERWYRFRNSKHFGIASPEEFVGLIDNAECVVTNSFHAVAFSIIMHTPFFVEINHKRSSRITHLLEIAGLQDRTLFDGKCTGTLDSEIDWNTVDNNLSAYISRSKEYIQLMI